MKFNGGMDLLIPGMVVSDIFGIGVWGHDEALEGSRGRASKTFQKHLLIWAPEGVREANFFILGINLIVGRINSRTLCNHVLTSSPKGNRWTFPQLSSQCYRRFEYFCRIFPMSDSYFRPWYSYLNMHKLPSEVLLPQILPNITCLRTIFQARCRIFKISQTLGTIYYYVSGRGRREISWVNNFIGNLKVVHIICCPLKVR